MGIYKDFAKKWWEAGYCPIPTNPKTKAPLVNDWQNFSEDLMSEDQLYSYLSAHANAAIGLVMGTTVKDGWRIAAIDVDDEELVENAKFAIGPFQSGKVGAKGLTVFVRVPPNVVPGTKRMVRKDKNGKKLDKPSIELLGIKSQTIIPPSIHPGTKKPYEWVGTSLLDVPFDTLPIWTHSLQDELEGMCNGQIDTILALNTMTWLGEGQGGNTHDVCKNAAALMVRRQWNDTEAYLRLVRAKKEACERNGETYNWPQEKKVIEEWIQSARAKGYDKQGAEAKTKAKKPVMERLMSDWAKQYLGGEDNVVTHSQSLRRYNDGHWPILDEDMLKRVLCREFKDVRGSEVEAAVKMLKNETYKPDFGMIPSVEVRDDVKLFRMCLTNGTLDLRTGKLERHRPEDELIHQLKFEWELDAKCPVFDKFIHEMFQGDQQKIDCVLEYMAYSLIPDNSFQKFMVLIGTGGNGKGTLTRLWQSLFDPNSISSVNVANLNNERMVAALEGKLLNISSEQSRFDQLSDSILKQITGNDPITTRKLFQEAKNNQRLWVRFLMQVNEMPSTNDTTDALGRRTIIINCPNQVIANPDLMLDKKLIAERCGVLKNHLIPALKRLYENDRFSEPEESDVLKKEWQNSNENVRYWLTECCNFAPKGQNMDAWTIYTTSRELYMHYNEFCKAMGFKYILNEMQWGTKLKSYGLDAVLRHHPVIKKTTRMRPIKVRDINDEF